MTPCALWDWYPYGAYLTYKCLLDNGIRGLFTKTGQRVELKLVVDQVLQTQQGDMVVARVRLLEYKGKDTPHAGIEMPLMEHFVLREGKIVEIFVYYWDTAEALAVLR